jgi:hypothetical protein
LHDRVFGRIASGPARESKISHANVGEREQRMIATVRRGIAKCFGPAKIRAPDEQ